MTIGTGKARRAAIVRDIEGTILSAQAAQTFDESLHVLAPLSRLLIGAQQSAISYVPDGAIRIDPLRPHAHILKEHRNEST